jgi:putative addiction module component (TIGR02574 family)
MAIKKSDLYSSLWASCDELRGGMDASQYKDYVLFMLFIKYISDKYGNSDDFAPPVTIPKGASFKDMIALKGSREEHLQLLEKLWHSLSSTPEAIPLTDTQREELDRRLDELDREGPVGIPAEEVLGRLHTRRA